MRNRTIKSFATGLATGAILVATALHFTAPANAEPSGAAVAVATVYGPEICAALARNNTPNGILLIGSALMDEGGLTAYQAGEAMGLAAAYICPEQLPALQAFVTNGAGSLA